MAVIFYNNSKSAKKVIEFQGFIRLRQNYVNNYPRRGNL